MKNSKVYVLMMVVVLTGQAFTRLNITNVPAQEMVFDKLIGTWKNNDGKSFEQWTKLPDGHYRSRAYGVKGVDTMEFENASIYRDGDHWIFDNLVKGQNDNKSVKFASVLVTAQSVQFSNPKHDFPTDINYSIEGPDRLHAYIVGPKNGGGKDTIHFRFTRVTAKTK